jgi:hypothetical protein
MVSVAGRSCLIIAPPLAMLVWHIEARAQYGFPDRLYPRGFFVKGVERLDIKSYGIDQGENKRYYFCMIEEIKLGSTTPTAAVEQSGNSNENGLEIVSTKTLKDLRASFPENSQKFYDQYFEKDTKEIYDFFDLDLQQFKLNYNKEGKIVSATLDVSFPKRSQAVGGNAHGGSVAFVLDSAMGIPFGFAELLPDEAIMIARELSKIEIIKAVPTNTPVTVEVVCDQEVDKRKFWMSAAIKRGDEVLVSAKSFFLKIPISKLIEQQQGQK